jgi:hypothetical protein
MRATSVYRADLTNVGDYACAPRRYFELGDEERDILSLAPQALAGAVIVGGGGLVAETFAEPMAHLAKARARLSCLIGWGLGESLHVDRRGGLVPPHVGRMPDYLGSFDLLGLRDYGTSYRWVPCASCMLPQFDQVYAPPLHDIVIYEHKRIPISIEGYPRRSNDGNDVDSAIAFLASAEVVVTNSYHGAYWATLLGKRVLAIPNMSKIYRLKHSPVIGHAEDWKRLVSLTSAYPNALLECREANISFHLEVLRLLEQSSDT